MRKDRNEKKKKRIIKIFIAVISIILVALIVLKINDHIILGKNKTINLIINNKNVTSNLKQDILIQDGEIYISKNKRHKLTFL